MNRTSTTHRTANRTVRSTTRTVARVALVAPLLTLVACGSDDDGGAATRSTAAAEPAGTDPPPAPDPGAGEGDSSAFCAAATELNESDGPPTIEQLQAYADVAPDELADPIATILDLFEETDGNFQLVFANPDGIAAIEQISVVEAEVCGIGDVPVEGANEVDPDATLVEIVATDYHFDTDFPSAAGRYSFVMTNEGAEVHLVVLAHLEDDADLDEVLASEGEAGVLDLHESGVAAPGGEAVLTADLAPGRWVMLCPIPDAEGTPHLALGMIHEFTVA